MCIPATCPTSTQAKALWSSGAAAQGRSGSHNGNSLMADLASRSASPACSLLDSRAFRLTVPRLSPASAQVPVLSPCTSKATPARMARRMARSCQHWWSRWFSRARARASSGFYHRPPTASGAITRPATSVLWPSRVTVGGGGRRILYDKRALRLSA